MPTISDSLRMLRDVDGVHGSFVVAGSGALVDRDLPAIFDSELLGEVGARVARLYETLVSGGGDMETCVLRYAEHKLFLRKTTWGILGILSTVGVNLPALRMVANLVIRRIDPEIAGTLPSFFPATKTQPSPAPHPSTQRSAGDPLAAASMPSIPPHDPLPIIPEDGRDATTATSDRHVHMYRGRPVGD
jgi:predicted regulator of Ras-like GTPase activity (Roadblock/LC7/MglB family)